MISRLWAYTFLFTTVLASCSRPVIELLELQPKDESVTEDGFIRCTKEDFDLDMAFVEDAYGYIILRTVLTSYSKDSLHIGYKDFHAEYGDFDDRNSSTVNSIDVVELIDFLEDEKDVLRAEKKRSTVGNAILVGLEALTIAATPGGNVAGAIVYAAESGIYIADERNAYRVAELSIEDEIKYIEDQVLIQSVIPPYEKEGYDVLFERIIGDDDLTIIAQIEDEVCEFNFEQYLIRVRR